jgi:ADP-ribosylglycohydrolase
VIGAIAGDVIGSVHEHSTKKSATFPLFDPRCHFTANTVLTVATALGILNRPDVIAYHAFARRYPDAGSGNGSAAWVSPVGWAFDTHTEVLYAAEWAAFHARAREEEADEYYVVRELLGISSKHREDIKGAEATALAVFLARSGASKEEIRKELMQLFPYDLRRNVEQIRDGNRCDVSSQGSVPKAIIAFLDSTDFEDAIRLALSLEGHAGRQAAIAGGIAQAFYRHVPALIAVKVRNLLPAEFIDIIDQFDDRFL